MKNVKDICNDLVINKRDGKEPVVSSKQLAKDFGKRHDNVLRDIDNLIEGILKIEETQGMLKIEQDPEKMFIEVWYKGIQNGQFYREYLLTRDGFSLLAMGFTGAKALEWKLKYIKAFNNMENFIKNDLLKINSQKNKEINELKLTINSLKALNEPITQGEHEINILRLFDMINVLVGSMDLIEGVHYKKENRYNIDYLFINFNKIYKHLIINYPNETMFKASIKTIKKALREQSWCKAIDYPIKMSNERTYTTEIVEAVMINIDDLLRTNININNIY